MHRLIVHVEQLELLRRETPEFTAPARHCVRPAVRTLIRVITAFGE